MLYLIATPIGTLSDFSFRGVETCLACDYLLCEDTRRSSILLDHYNIKKPLKSYHQFNETEKLPWIIEDLKQGRNIGILSDGGTPALCDPGETLIQACLAEEIPITSIPGPCAFVQALVLSGFPTHPFQFLGFMPRKESEILSLLPYILSFPGTSICYESPQRLLATLQLIANLFPKTLLAVARELTKTFEQVIRLPALDAYSYFSSHPPRGEIVLLIQGGKNDFLHSSAQSPKELALSLVETYKIPLSEAIKTAAHLLKIPKQTLYKLFHHEK